MGLRKRYFSARSVATDPIHGPVPDLLESLNLQPTKVRGKLYKLKMPFYSLLRAIGHPPFNFVEGERDTNGDLLFIGCLTGTFPWMKCSVKASMEYLNDLPLCIRLHLFLTYSLKKNEINFSDCTQEWKRRKWRLNWLRLKNGRIPWAIWIRKGISKCHKSWQIMKKIC